jgi:hypothetical protein
METTKVDKRRKPYAGQPLSSKVQPYRDRKGFEHKRKEAAVKGWATRKGGTCDS